MSTTPLVEFEAEEYFAGLRDGQLRLPRCSKCDELVWHPRAQCPWCMSSVLQYETLSGRGSVYSFTINYRGQGAYADSPPFTIAFVELDEGPRLLAHVTAGPGAVIGVGSTVAIVAVDPDGDELPTPTFTVVTS